MDKVFRFRCTDFERTSFYATKKVRINSKGFFFSYRYDRRWETVYNSWLRRLHLYNETEKHILFITSLTIILNRMKFLYPSWNSLYENIWCTRYERRLHNVRKDCWFRLLNEYSWLYGDRWRLIEGGCTER